MPSSSEELFLTATRMYIFCKRQTAPDLRKLCHAVPSVGHGWTSLAWGSLFQKPVEYYRVQLSFSKARVRPGHWGSLHLYVLPFFCPGK